jgi:hypothetical protein
MINKSESSVHIIKVVESLYNEARDHKKQERYHRRKAKNLMQDLETLRHDLSGFGIKLNIVGKNEKEL